MHDSIQRLIVPYGQEALAKVDQLINGLPWQRITSRSGSSLLTPSGAPIEATFVSRSNALRLTVEPHYPHASLAEKWGVIQTLVSTGKIFDSLHYGLIKASGQRYGVWLGLRAGHFKIYQEVPPSACDIVRREYQKRYGGGSAITPLMVGTDENNQVEFYGMLIQPNFQRLHEFFARNNIASYLPWVIDALGFLGARSRVQVFEQLRLGMSQGPRGITIFTAVRMLAHTDIGFRQRILRLANGIDRSMLAYEQATQELEEHELENASLQRGIYKTQVQLPRIHGMVGLSITPYGEQLSVGVAPF